MHVKRQIGHAPARQCGRRDKGCGLGVLMRRGRAFRGNGRGKREVSEAAKMAAPHAARPEAAPYRGTTMKAPPPLEVAVFGSYVGGASCRDSKLLPQSLS